MCAINGFNFNNENLIKRMNCVTRHRGPDGTGVFLNDEMTLGHNRLSIIDTRKIAAQPMVSNDGRYVIVLNGEIYNFRELRNELASGYTFRTNSDTEVLLASYRKWGSKCVNKLNGMFAFAIWDTNKKELFLGRDQIGIKPLYYFWDEKQLIFSSEIKGILEHKVPRKLDTSAFAHYFRILYVPEPRTMFEGIKKLPPAHFATLVEGKFTLTRYWSSHVLPVKRGDRKKIDVELKKRVCESVKRQLISDKPLGIYLSGGIDSSIVLDCASRERTAPLDTFSVGFDVTVDEERGKYNADFDLARRTAQYYGTKHHELLLPSTDIPQLFERVMKQTDDPISNPTAIPMMELANFAKQHVDVVLSGDGGDELFGGYERYRLSLAATKFQCLPDFMKYLANFNTRTKKLNIPAGIERYSLFMFEREDVLSRVLSTDLVNEKTHRFFEEHYGMTAGVNDFESVFMDVDRQSWLVDESLSLADKMSMSAGLEQRVPLLDVELVMFSAGIPLQYKVDLFNTKIILKNAFRVDIPDFLFKQPKRGWFSPGAKWLRRPSMRRFVGDVLTPTYYSPTSALFEWESIRTVFEDHCEKREYNLTVLWALISFQLWARTYQVTLE